MMTFIIFAVFFVSIFSGLVALDGLVHRLYRNHKDEWIDCGRPAGMFRTPQEVVELPFGMGFASSLANAKVSWRWLFVTPKWMKQEPDAIRLVRTMRFSALIMWTSFIVLALGAFTQRNEKPSNTPAQGMLRSAPQP